MSLSPAVGRKKTKKAKDPNNTFRMVPLRPPTNAAGVPNPMNVFDHKLVRSGWLRVDGPPEMPIPHAVRTVTGNAPAAAAAPPPPAAAAAAADFSGGAWHRRFSEFYSRHAPEKVATVSDLLAQIQRKGVDPEVLWDRVLEKYGHTESTWRPIDWPTRLARFYEIHCPSKVSLAPTLAAVEHQGGDLPALWATMLRKYNTTEATWDQAGGGCPAAPPARSATRPPEGGGASQCTGNPATWRTRFEEFYDIHRPEKVPMVPEILRRMRARGADPFNVWRLMLGKFGVSEDTWREPTPSFLPTDYTSAASPGDSGSPVPPPAWSDASSPHAKNSARLTQTGAEGSNPPTWHSPTPPNAENSVPQTQTGARSHSPPPASSPPSSAAPSSPVAGSRRVSTRTASPPYSRAQPPSCRGEPAPFAGSDERSLGNLQSAALGSSSPAHQKPPESSPPLSCSLGSFEFWAERFEMLSDFVDPPATRRSNRSAARWAPAGSAEEKYPNGVELMRRIVDWGAAPQAAWGKVLAAYGLTEGDWQRLVERRQSVDGQVGFRAESLASRIGDFPEIDWTSNFTKLFRLHDPTRLPQVPALVGGATPSSLMAAWHVLLDHYHLTEVNWDTETRFTTRVSRCRVLRSVVFAVFAFKKARKLAGITDSRGRPVPHVPATPGIRVLESFDAAQGGGVLEAKMSNASLGPLPSAPNVSPSGDFLQPRASGGSFSRGFSSQSLSAGNVPDTPVDSPLGRTFTGVPSVRVRVEPETRSAPTLPLAPPPHKAVPASLHVPALQQQQQRPRRQSPEPNTPLLHATPVTKQPPQPPQQKGQASAAAPPPPPPT
ncbi:hypothetical protein DIPPA_02757 [Diplonema papillatum]|nr:hypothetical protein DIPPA_02757 [Diplonema papillatum]